MTKKIRALCVVAHPDDETIWMGGTIMKKDSWEWTIFSLCRKNDSDRMPKFRKTCDLYGADSIISDLDDEVLEPLKIKEIENKILENLSEKEYEHVFTHGENGEYGHIRHREIHKAVKSLARKNNIKCGKLFFFSYDIFDGENIPKPTEKADLIINLTSAEKKKKKKLITDVYGFAEDSFESLSCNQKEAFILSK